MEKLAIITSEGGMRCAYSVGVILALVEKYHLKKPDFVIGASGSTGTLSYFVSGQYKSIKNIWENLLSTEKFISAYRLEKVMDIDYLVDEVFRKEDPLNVAAVKSSSIELFIMLTDVESGKPVYFSQKEVDIFEALRASSAMPVFFNKSVSINGRKYIDGAISFHLEDGVALAKKLGATKIIAINNRNRSLISRLSEWMYFLSQNKMIRQAMRRPRLDIKDDASVFLIQPLSKLPVSTLDNNKKRLKQTIRIGYMDASRNTSLSKFLESSNLENL